MSFTCKRQVDHFGRNFKVELEIYAQNVYTIMQRESFMIKRKVAEKLVQVSKQVPVVTVIGPRQSGKTTLVKELSLIHI